MQYSPHCAMPYVAMVDAGTVELVREHGRGGGDLGGTDPAFRSAMESAALESHLEAGRRVDRVRASAFRLIASEAERGIGSGMGGAALRPGAVRKAGLITDHGPMWP